MSFLRVPAMLFGLISVYYRVNPFLRTFLKNCRIMEHAVSRLRVDFYLPEGLFPCPCHSTWFFDLCLYVCLSVFRRDIYKSSLLAGRRITSYELIVCLSFFLSVCLFLYFCQSVCLCVCLSVCLSPPPPPLSLSL